MVAQGEAEEDGGWLAGFTPPLPQALGSQGLVIIYFVVIIVFFLIPAKALFELLKEGPVIA